MINYNYLSCTDYDGKTKEINFCSENLPESASADCTYLALHTDDDNPNILHVKKVDATTLQNTIVRPITNGISDSVAQLQEALPWKSNKIYKASMEFYAEDIVLPDGKTTASFCFSGDIYFSSLAYIEPRSFSKDSYGDFISSLGAVATKPWLLNGSPITLNNTAAATDQPKTYPTCWMFLGTDQLRIAYRAYASDGYNTVFCYVPISSFGNGDIISLSISEA